MKSRSDRKKEEPSGLSASGGLAQAGSNDSEVRHLIAVRAYELYRERGGRDGHDLDDWLKAEQAILGHEVKPEGFVKSVL